MTSVMGLGLGLGLAGAAGVRTYLPLIVMGLLTRFSETLSYRPPFRVFASVPVLLLLIALAGYELMVERSKDVSVGQFFTSIGLRAIGGAVIFAGLFEGFGTIFGIVVGMIIAVVSHMLKIRLYAVYGATEHRRDYAGLEETVAVAGTVLAVLYPWSSYIIWVSVLILYLKKLRNTNNRYKSELKARSWR